MSIIEKLTEGVVRRDVQKEGAAILDKWEKTGLLEGIGNDHTRNNMAALLENQAKELLREASTMAAGDVEGLQQLHSLSFAAYLVVLLQMNSFQFNQ